MTFVNKLEQADSLPPDMLEPIADSNLSTVVFFLVCVCVGRGVGEEGRGGEGGHAFIHCILDPKFLGAQLNMQSFLFCLNL